MQCHMMAKTEIPPTETAAITAGPLPPIRQNLADWLYHVRKADLDPKAKISDWLGHLPPPESRHRGPLPHVSGTDLKNFELQPIVKEEMPSSGPDALVVAGALAAAAAPSKDLRMQIWELVHKVHDHFTGQWPHEWKRPPFANDAKNPQLEEWRDYAEQLMKTSKGQLKGQLEDWRDAGDTPPDTRSALIALLEKYAKFGAKLKAKREKEKAAREQHQRQQQQQQATQSFQERQQSDLQALEQRIPPQVKQLQLQAQQLLDSYGKKILNTQKQQVAGKMKAEDFQLHVGYMKQIQELQFEYQRMSQEIWQRVPPSVGGEAESGASVLGEPDAKRPRL